MAIKAVFFDIGNVLVRFDPSALFGAFARLLRAHPLRVVGMVLSRELSDSVERGHTSCPAVYRRLRRELGFRGDYAEFRRLWCGHFTLDRRAAGLLRRVARGRSVYLLSNTNSLHFEHIRARYAFVRHARGSILSYRLRLRKPEAAIYEAALRRARCRPEEAVFIDDLRENVDAAARLGMHAVLYRGPEDLERRLKDLGAL